MTSFKPECGACCLPSQVILEAVERGEPVTFFCKLGKDRTGLISMLVLSCCGASEQDIISDYVRCPA